MTEVENLVHEHLKRLQSEFELMRDDKTGMRSEMLVTKQHPGAFMSHEVAQDGDLASIRDHRIERRLELRD